MKSSKIIATLTAVCSIAPLMLSAKTPNPPSVESGTHVPAGFTFSLGGEYSRVHQVTSDGVPNYDGNLGGVLAKFEYERKNHLYAVASALWNEGRLKSHKGPRADVTEGVWEGGLGYTLSWGSERKWMLTPFAGFGYRKFVNELGRTPQTSAITISYQSYYIPVGIKLEYSSHMTWRYGFTGKIMPSVDQRLYVYSVTGTYWKEVRKCAYSAEFPITYSLLAFGSSRFELSLVPFVKYWQMGSASVAGLPNVKQIYWGSDLVLGLTY
ncbi:MAG: hypothetical protein ABSA17_04615 [Rhabdochlamydiaceae bacterium]|jgi:hypothetical protein